MLLRTLATLLLAPKVQYGVLSSSTPSTQNDCMKLIQKGGRIACNLTGQQDYDRMSINNCWVICKENFNTFMIPHIECERIFKVDSWLAFQQTFGKLPPFGFEDCGDEYKKRLEKWVNDWAIHEEKAKKTICPHPAT
uniref:Salivary secreted protein n=1 Tax=Ixodes ricinus TaxID=34613 RepID=V5HXS6_IXORI